MVECNGIAVAMINLVLMLSSCTCNLATSVQTSKKSQTDNSWQVRVRSVFIFQSLQLAFVAFWESRGMASSIHRMQDQAFLFIESTRPSIKRWLSCPWAVQLSKNLWSVLEGIQAQDLVFGIRFVSVRKFLSASWAILQNCPQIFQDVRPTDGEKEGIGNPFQEDGHSRP